MERDLFLKLMDEIDVVAPEEELKERVATNAREDDLPICIGELSELTLELTRFQRGKMNADDLLQELSHVQWTVWRLQNMFGVSDEKLRRAIQASFR